MSDYLLRFSPAEQKILTALSGELRLSFSNNIKFLQYIFELLKIEENLSFENIITSLQITDIMQNTQLQGKQKGEEVLAKLFALRFPESAELIKKGEFNV